MNFICKHCEKQINCASIIVDGVFLHATCEDDFKKKKKIIVNKEEVVKKWKASGLLNNLVKW